MRVTSIALALLWVAASASAQQMSQSQPTGADQAAQMDKTFTSSSDVLALVAKAKSEHKEGQAVVLERLLRLAPYNANLEYRASVGTASVHEHDAEFFYVIDGSATMVTGGKLVNETRTNPANLIGTGIEGGESRHVSKGDFIVVPENTPHWFSAIDGTLILMTLHVPHPVPGGH